ncbi:hypothetical protein CEXT_576621 [Caerostris extrusa]|uniref:Uncharacterized protein n=1 Tax=Caerostris extrusa TaxID=172846 RepID=A0AAV4Y652_CAEEX|nr:hypothetical protein CEXT_576621 [Caerostris extrusa]
MPPQKVPSANKRTFSSGSQRPRLFTRLGFSALLEYRITNTHPHSIYILEGMERNHAQPPLPHPPKSEHKDE